MNEITRRHVLKGLLATPVVYSFSRPAFAATTLRCDVASPGGQEMLAIYADAIRAMQQLGAENPNSWMWWWYTHFVDGATTKDAELTRVFGADTTSPTRLLANDCWNTCQSHAGQNSNHFLPWHRMYTYYIERVVRAVTGRTDFAMPYWNYTSSDPAYRGVVPVQFRTPDDPVFGVLYRANRGTLANTGQPIHKNQAGDAMNIDDAMAKTAYNTVGSEMGFCRSIDSGIHGRIHTLTGNTHGMGAVPYAGNDPLFFVHHANIDRMWASWNKNGNKNPTDAVAYPWINNAFVMADANGTRVSRQIKTLYSALALGYDYDAFFPKPPVTPPAAPATMAKSLASIVATSTKVASTNAMADLAAGATTVKLVRETTAKATNVLGLDTDGRRALLVLRKLHTWKQPGVLYHVYLCATPNGPLEAASYVGNINFFDAEFHDHGGGSKLDTALGENFYSFDVTPHLQNIAKKPHGVGARDALFVRIVPGGTPMKDAGPMVAQIDLMRQ